MKNVCLALLFATLVVSTSYATDDQFFENSAQDKTCKMLVESADKYLGPGNELGPQAHEVICDKYVKLFMGCAMELKDTKYKEWKFKNGEEKAKGLVGTYCGMVVVGYNQGNIMWQRAKKSSSGPKEAILLHSKPYFYENFLFDFEGSAEIVKFIQRIQDQDQFDYENQPRNAISLLFLKPSKGALHDLHFRLRAFLVGYNKLRHFIGKEHNIPMFELELEKMFSPEGKMQRF